MIRIPSRAHTIRFPEDLYIKIKLLADKNNRNFNNEVVNLLQIGYTISMRTMRAQEEAMAEAVETLNNG
jgi:hypothetical protein